MDNKSILDLIIDLLGLGILIWFLSLSLIDLIRGTKRKTVFHNLLVIGICLIYSLKIILKDLLGVVGGS